MSAQALVDARVNKGKQPIVNPPPLSNPGRSGPTTFFLKSESEIEKSMQSRGRRTSRDSKESSQEQGNSQTWSSSLADSSFGVQSLEDTISESLYSDRTSTILRAESNDVEQGAQEMPDSPDLLRLNNRKRKTGNPVHPSIRSAGNRIISSEQSSAQPSSVASPASFRSSESPFRSHLRRASYSSINLGQPLTPLRASPLPGSALPSTPRSGSLRSFRLSDEEISVTSETHSQAIHSSSDDEEEEVLLDSAGEEGEQEQPQLVMPSISMPSRKPFTERGRNMGRLKVMVTGSSGCGKSTLINCISRISPDVVHMDPVTTIVVQEDPPKTFSETFASTKPHPVWGRSADSVVQESSRRKSFSETMLERNLSFIETPGIDSEGLGTLVSRELDRLLFQNTRLEAMSDDQLMELFSGAGGTYVDIVLYLIRPDGPIPAYQSSVMLSLIQKCVVIPVISHADSCTPADIAACRKQITEIFRLHHSSRDITCLLGRIPHISCIPANDSEEVDASLLMSPDYHPPLQESDLSGMVNALLSPEMITRLRYESAKKFLDWRSTRFPPHLTSQEDFLSPSPRSFSSSSPLPQPTSPSAEPSSQALARLNSLTNPSPSHQPFSQMRLAKWAEDLQRSLAKDRSRYTHLPHKAFPDSSSDSDLYERSNEKALTRPARGRLGGDLAVIDPSDPLGILSAVQNLHQRGWFALQVSAGVAVVWWIVRNWAEWTGWGEHDYGVVEAVAVQAPGREGWAWW